MTELPEDPEVDPMTASGYCQFHAADGIAKYRLHSAYP